MAKASGQRVAKAAGIIMVAFFVSRVVGFVREQVMTTQFGKGYITDAYIAAFTIPDMLYNLLLGGALSAAFIPVFSAYLAKDQDDDAWEVASTVINLAIILFTIGITLGIIFTPKLLPLVAYKLAHKSQQLSIVLTRIMFPAVLFTGLNGIMMGILNSYQNFLSPAIGSIIYNIGIIATGVILGKYYGFGIKGFAIGVIVGVVGNFLIQIPNVRKHNPKYRLILNLKHPGVRKMGALILPALLGLSVSQLELLVNQNFASSLSEGTITALRIANRIMLMPLGIFAFSIAMAVFPTLSAHAATGKMDKYRKTFSMGVRTSIFIIMPATVGLSVLGQPIIRLLFQQGKWNSLATMETSKILIYYCIGMFAQSAILVITRGFYAINDTKTPVYVGLVSIFLTFFSNLILIKLMGAAGLALGMSLVTIINMMALLYLLRRKVGRIDAKNIILSFIKSLIAASLMGIVSYLVSFGVADLVNLHSKINQSIQVITAVTAGALVYAIISYILKMEEMNSVIDIFKKRFGKKNVISEA